MPPPAFRFGAFRLDLASFQLQRDGVALSQPPKVIDLLALMAARPGALLTKDDILAAVWPGVAVTDNAITQVVSAAREALGDDPASPRFIQTVPRKGYRFIAAVTRDADPPPPAAAPSVSVRETPSLDAYRAMTEGRVKLDALDVRQAELAIGDFERAIALDPQYAPAHVGLAHAHFWLHQQTRLSPHRDDRHLKAAIHHVRTAIALAPDLGEAHAALALLLAQTESYAEAIAAGRTATTLEPHDWRHRFRLALALWGGERLSCLEGVHQQFPTFAYAYFAGAMVHTARGDLTAAASVLDAGLAAGAGTRRFPANGLHWLRGLVHHALGDVTAARAAFDLELAQDQQGLYSLEYRRNASEACGFACLSLSDPAQAGAWFTRALEVSPNHPRALLGLAETHRVLGRRPDAHAALDRAEEAINALAAAGRQTDAAMARAHWHIALGHPEDAIADLQTLVDTAPPGMAGWTIPVEPWLARVRPTPAFAPILAALRRRAQ